MSVVDELSKELSRIKKTVEDLKKEVEVDADALDVEWATFAERHLAVMDALSRAKKLEKDVKAEFDLTKSRLYTEISKNLKEQGERVTEASIQSAMNLDPEHEELSKLRNEAEALVNAASDLSWAMSSKKTALENLVTLWSSRYFAGPSEPLDLSGRLMLAKQQKEKSEQARKLIKRTLKKGE